MLTVCGTSEKKKRRRKKPVAVYPPVPWVDLTTYDLIVVNSSAGKDSQAMLDRVVFLAKEQGVLDRVVVLHADLARVEWAGTKELAFRQARFYGVRFISVKRKQGDLLSEVRVRRMWPDAARRWCTAHHKRNQCWKILTALTAESRRKTGKKCIRILNCMGLRAEESGKRAEKNPLCKSRASNKTRRHVDDWLPIHDWSEQKVWETIRASGCPHHFAYDLGMKRLSCVFCIFAPRSALLLAGQHNPELLAEYVQVEREIGHSFKMNLPIIQIKEALDRGERAEVCEDWQM